MYAREFAPEVKRVLDQSVIEATSRTVFSKLNRYFYDSKGGIRQTPSLPTPSAKGFSRWLRMHGEHHEHAWMMENEVFNGGGTDFPDRDDLACETIRDLLLWEGGEELLKAVTLTTRSHPQSQYALEFRPSHKGYTAEILWSSWRLDKPVDIMELGFVVNFITSYINWEAITVGEVAYFVARERKNIKRLIDNWGYNEASKKIKTEEVIQFRLLGREHQALMWFLIEDEIMNGYTRRKATNLAQWESWVGALASLAPLCNADEAAELLRVGATPQQAILALREGVDFDLLSQVIDG